MENVPFRIKLLIFGQAVLFVITIAYFLMDKMS